jgi:LmbE family N-acetylglucosaminyl deacetylase
MLTKNPLAAPASRLYLLAHQDDEMACLALIENDRRQGNTSHFIYLADQEPDAERRNLETLNMLAHFGIPAERVHFLGQQHSLPQLQLIYHLPQALAAVTALVNSLPAPPQVITLAYEGGHPDHDAVFLIAAALHAQGKVTNTYTVSLYHSGYWPAPFYSCGRPLPASQAPYVAPLSLLESLGLVTAARFYPSQTKTWCGLLPPILLNLWRFGGLPYHQLDISRAHHRPHEGRLLYEQRFAMPYTSFIDTARPFIAQYLTR